MNKKTTDGVEEVAKKVVKKTTTARKPRTTRKKAASNEVVENKSTEAEEQPKSETVTEQKTPGRPKKTTTPQRRGRKPQQKNEAEKELTAPAESQQNEEIAVPAKEQNEEKTAQNVTNQQVDVIAEEQKESKVNEKIAEVENEVLIPEPATEQKTETVTDLQSDFGQKPAQQFDQGQKQQKQKPIPPLPHVRIDSIIALANAPRNQIILSDQQIQQLTVAEAIHRHNWLEGVLAYILDYDVVLSDTNIWIELLVGHTSSHSDPRVNARLMFERQLEFISKLAHYRGGRFMMMAETYEEIDRFATQQDPVNYKEADFTDEGVCRNIAARLAKRLILSQQRENRLRIEGICAESHHAAFADPAIIRRTVEMFADGKKVLLITNDASVAIRSMGMCDDLQLVNGIDDETWDKVYAPLRPMVLTMDDLKVLDLYTRQYHFLQMAAGKQWMEDIPRKMSKHNVQPLMLWLDGFRPGDRYAENHEEKQQKKRQSQQKQKEQKEKQEQKEQAQQPKPTAPQQRQQKQSNQQKLQKQSNQPQQQPQSQQLQPVQLQQPQQVQQNVRVQEEHIEAQQPAIQKQNPSNNASQKHEAPVNVQMEQNSAPMQDKQQVQEPLAEEQPRKRQYRRRPPLRRKPQQNNQ